jgi:acid stress-induced BolA-like protein IbaG/YrbA
MTTDEIKTLIETGIAGATALVEGDDGVHFAARVIAPAFAGLSPVKRHQLVYAALGDRMQRDLHALSIQTFTPEQWEEAKNFKTL